MDWRRESEAIADDPVADREGVMTKQMGISPDRMPDLAAFATAWARQATLDCDERIAREVIARLDEHDRWERARGRMRKIGPIQRG